MPSLDIPPAPALSSPVADEAVDVGVTSETARLERVLVHQPGREMDLVSPETREDLLFEDILFTGTARSEHELMCALFRRVAAQGGAVLKLRTLLAEVFEEEEAREHFVEALCRAEPDRNLEVARADLLRIAPDALLDFALTGQTDELPVVAPPLPNLFFTRDLAATVHDHIVLGHAATTARSREGLLLRTVLRHHPAFASLGDRTIEMPPGVTFEGGDLLVPDPKVVLIGHSQRTSLGGVMATAKALFEKTPVEHVLAVEIPQRRSCMHLDTVLTFAAPGECVVYPPLLERAGFGYAVHFTPTGVEGRFTSDMRPNLRRVLPEVLGREIEFIPCGGGEHLHQAREQWTDGSNVFAIAPGVVVGYERNRRTFEELRKRGYRVASARSFLEYHDETGFTPGDEKIAIKLEGTELSRGRGGPRCMTLPLARAAAAEEALSAKPETGASAEDEAKGSAGDGKDEAEDS